MKKNSKKKVATQQKQTSKRIGRLKTSTDAAKFMARCIRGGVRGEGDMNTNYKLVMMASMLVKTLEVSSLEQRIEQLERTLKQKGIAT